MFHQEHILKGFLYQPYKKCQNFKETFLEINGHFYVYPPIQIPPLKTISPPLTSTIRLSESGPFRKCQHK